MQRKRDREIRKRRESKGKERGNRPTELSSALLICLFFQSRKTSSGPAISGAGRLAGKWRHTRSHNCQCVEGQREEREEGREAVKGNRKKNEGGERD
jgi:hypothetical protein